MDKNLELEKPSVGDEYGKTIVLSSENMGMARMVKVAIHREYRTHRKTSSKKSACIKKKQKAAQKQKAQKKRASVSIILYYFLSNIFFSFFHRNSKNQNAKSRTLVKGKPRKALGNRSKQTERKTLRKSHRETEKRKNGGLQSST